MQINPTALIPNNLFAFDLLFPQVNQTMIDGSYQRGWQVLLAFAVALSVAQWIKIFHKVIKTHRFDLRLLAKTGGMPSSHSSSTVAMAVSVGLIEGFNSVSFSIALCLALVVMYDAAGVRRTVGLQAQVVNQMLEELFSNHPTISGQRIKEFLGHTPKEVLVGAILGGFIAWLCNQWVTSWV